MLRLAVMVSSFLLAATVAAGTGGPKLDPRMMPPSCGPGTCVILYNGGGYVDEFQRMARHVKEHRGRVVIDGPCLSSCTLLADLARPNVCVTSRAVMFIHQAAALKDGKVVRSDVKYSADIAAWIARSGGQPTNGFLPMMPRDQLAFWKRCKIRG